MQVPIADRDVLAEEIFPTRFGSTWLLRRMADGGWHIRFNREELLRCELGARELDAVVTMQRTIEQCAYTFPLEPGDCLVLNNSRAAHGRTAFEENSQRLLLRMRVYRRAEAS